MDISVILATFRRDDILQRTLESFCNLHTGSLSWELIVVDNACEENTKAVASSFSSRLPIHYLEESKPGKNNALLSAIPKSQGQLLVFTDDDVIAESDWLEQYLSCANRLLEFDIFGGKILPSFPESVTLDTRVPLDHPFTRSSFGLTDWEQEEGAIKPSRIWGANMAVRRRVIEQGLTFNPSVGPKGANYIMGSETEFLNRAHDAGIKMAYLPSAVVQHQVRPEQMTLDWIRGRAFRLGRGRVAVSQEFQVFNKLWGVPLFVWRQYVQLYLKSLLFTLGRQNTRAYDTLIEYEQIRGIVSELRRR